MFLTKLLILNNKSCKKLIIEPSISEPEILIGINDCGKSTILRSLDTFFDEKKTLTFLRENQQKSDLSNESLSEKEINQILEQNNFPSFCKFSGDIITILCEFKLEPCDIENEEFQENSKNSHLKWSIGDSNKVVVMRVFHNNSDGANNLSGYYLLVKDFQDDNGEYIEAWRQNKSELKTIRKKFNIVDADVNNENGKGPFRNIEEIRAIYKKLGHKIVDRWSLYTDFSKDRSFFPSFRYLDWNFSLKDLEDIATEAMNEVTDPLLQEIKKVASTKQNEAIAGVNKKFSELIKGLKDELPKNIKKISSSVFFDVSQKITDIKLEKDGCSGEIHIDNQGDGVKRQIWFAILKWRSMLPAGTSPQNKYIWCFDEPETHLYPSAQRQLFSTFLEMAKNEFQIFLSTHSTVFIDRVMIKNINTVILEDGYSVVNKADNIDDIFTSLGIRNSDFLFYDKFLAVEGPTEYELFPELYKLKTGRTLLEDGIQIINLKGERQWSNYKNILEEILSQFRKSEDKIFYVFDNDQNISGSNIYKVGTIDIEDSIPNHIWIKYVKDNCDIDISDQFLNDEIRANMKPEKDKKFYKLLQDYVAKNKVSNYLPPKGTESGSLLINYFQSIDDIPESINNLIEDIEKK